MPALLPTTRSGSFAGYPLTRNLARLSARRGVFLWPLRAEPFFPQKVPTAIHHKSFRSCIPAKRLVAVESFDSLIGIGRPCVPEACRWGDGECQPLSPPFTSDPSADRTPTTGAWRHGPSDRDEPVADTTTPALPSRVCQSRSAPPRGAGGAIHRRTGPGTDTVRGGRPRKPCGKHVTLAHRGCFVRCVQRSAVSYRPTLSRRRLLAPSRRSVLWYGSRACRPALPLPAGAVQSLPWLSTPRIHPFGCGSST